MSFNSIFQLLSDNLNNQMLEFLFKCTPWLIIPYVSLLFYGPTLHKILPSEKLKKVIKNIRNYIVVAIYFISTTMIILFFIWGVGYFLERISNENTYMSLAISILGMGLLFLLVIDLLLYQLSPTVLDSRIKQNFSSNYFLLNYFFEKLAAPFSCYFAITLTVKIYYTRFFPGLIIWFLYHSILLFIRCYKQIPNRRTLTLEEKFRYLIFDIAIKNIKNTLKKHYTLMKQNLSIFMNQSQKK